MVYNQILLFEFANNGWSEMESDGIYYIHLSTFIPFDLGCMPRNEIACYVLFHQIIKKYTDNGIEFMFHSAPLHSISSCSALF